VNVPGISYWAKSGPELVAPCIRSFVCGQRLQVFFRCHILLVTDSTGKGMHFGWIARGRTDGWLLASLNTGPLYSHILYNDTWEHYRHLSTSVFHICASGMNVTEWCISLFLDDMILAQELGGWRVFQLWLNMNLDLLEIL